MRTAYENLFTSEGFSERLQGLPLVKAISFYGRLASLRLESIDFSGGAQTGGRHRARLGEIEQRNWRIPDMMSVQGRTGQRWLVA